MYDGEFASIAGRRGAARRVPQMHAPHHKPQVRWRHHDRRVGLRARGSAVRARARARAHAVAVASAVATAQPCNLVPAEAFGDPARVSAAHARGAELSHAL